MMKRHTALVVATLAVAGLTFAGCDKVKKEMKKEADKATKQAVKGGAKAIKDAAKDAAKDATSDKVKYTCGCGKSQEVAKDATPPQC